MAQMNTSSFALSYTYVILQQMKFEQARFTPGGGGLAMFTPASADCAAKCLAYAPCRNA